MTRITLYRKVYIMLKKTFLALAVLVGVGGITKLIIAKTTES